MKYVFPKKIIFTFFMFTISYWASCQNLYNADGTLTSMRTVTMSDRNLTFVPTTPNSQIFFNGRSGYVGLGTLLPQSTLHLATGDARLDLGKLTVGSTFTTWDEAVMKWGIKSSRGIVLQQTATGPPASFSAYYDNSSIEMTISKCTGCFSNNAQNKDAVLRGSSYGSFIISNENTGNIKFETRATTTSSSQIQMVIDKNGNVGIGTGNATLNSSEKLAVNGLIHTKEVKVDMIGWPDYVFSRNYKLPSLKNVENYININGHLEGVPTAAEVENKGVLIGQMNKILLEKIEELTLYVIQLNKEVEELRKTQN